MKLEGIVKEGQMRASHSTLGSLDAVGPVCMTRENPWRAFEAEVKFFWG
jgi:hypothetical protein